MKRFVTMIALGCAFVFAAGRGLSDPKKDEVPSLIKSLKSKSAKARISAAEDLGHIGAIQAADTKEAVPVLIEILKSDKDAGVRKAAAAALGRIDPDPEQALPAFITALKDKSPLVRAAAATALGQLGSDAKDAVSALKDARDDKDRNVSRAAGMALRSIQGKKN